MRTHLAVILMVTTLAMSSLLLMRAAEARSDEAIYLTSAEQRTAAVTQRDAPVERGEARTRTRTAIVNEAADSEEVSASTTNVVASTTEEAEEEAVATEKEVDKETETAAVEEKEAAEETDNEAGESTEPVEMDSPSDPESESDHNPEPQLTPEPEPSPVPEVNDEEILQAEPVTVETETVPFLAAVALAIHERTNEERAKRGLPLLAYDTFLASIADGHSEDMVANDFFAHEDEAGCDMTCRFAAAGYQATAWGENIAWRSFVELGEPEAVARKFVDAWLMSTEHRNNIISEDYTVEGIGVAKIGNKLYVTVNFATPQ